MRPDVIRLYKTLHTWTGIVAGLALFVAFYAGAVTVFQEPLARWAAAPQATAPGVRPADMPALLAAIAGTRPAAAKEGITLHLPQHGDTSAWVGWHEHAGGRDSPEVNYHAWLDAEGAVQIRQQQPSDLTRFIDFIHQRAGLPEGFDAGEWLMGGISLLYALALISGVIVLLPTLVSDFFALRLGRNLKRFWLDAHNVAGIISLPFHIIMALTATVFLLHDPIYGLQDKLLHDGKLMSAWRQPAAPASSGPLPALLTPEALLQRLQEQAPGFSPRDMTWRTLGQPDASVWIGGHDDRFMNRGALGGFAIVSAYDGHLIRTDVMPGHASPGNALVASFFSLHFASFGGDTVRWGYFLLGLAGAFLFYSGNLLWVESRRKLTRRDQPPATQSRSTHLMAALTVGVALGCISGISLSIAGGKWLHGHVDDLNSWHRGIYYVVFLACAAWAQWRGAARSAIELLGFAALATLLIPLTSLLAWALPASGLWFHEEALGVDLTALAGAAALALMAWAAARRAARGPADSVWSLARP